MNEAVRSSLAEDAEERYRRRQGQYGIVYWVDEDEQGVLVAKIGQRTAV